MQTSNNSKKSDQGVWIFAFRIFNTKRPKHATQWGASHKPGIQSVSEPSYKHPIASSVDCHNLRFVRAKG